MELMSVYKCRLVERSALVGLAVAVATFIASAWTAGWPNEEYPLQPWAAAIGIPAFLLGAFGSLVASWCESDNPGPNSD
jgi:hypothetical protein